MKSRCNLSGAVADTMHRKNRHLRRGTTGFLAAALFIPAVALTVGLAASPAGASTFSITPWGVIGGGVGVTSVDANFNDVGGPAINAGGDAVGHSTNSAPNSPPGHAVLFKGGTLTDLGGLGAVDFTGGLAVNASDEVVGSSLTNGGANESPVAWSSGNIRNLAPSLQGAATAINDPGTIVGYLGERDTPREAVEYGGLNNLGITPLGDISNPSSPPLVYANGISDSGQIIGDAQNSAGAQEAVTFSGGSATPLPTTPGAVNSVATAISANNGYIVGFTSTTTTREAVQFGPGPVAISLGVLSGDVTSAALAVNSSGVAVGFSTDSNGNQTPVLFNGGGVFDLSSYLPANSGWVLHTANGINDSNVIVGNGTYHGTFMAYTMTLAAVPQAPPSGGIPIISPVLQLLLAVLHLL